MQNTSRWPMELAEDLLSLRHGWEEEDTSKLKTSKIKLYPTIEQRRLKYWKEFTKAVFHMHGYLKTQTGEIHSQLPALKIRFKNEFTWK